MVPTFHICNNSIIFGTVPLQHLQQIDRDTERPYLECKEITFSFRSTNAYKAISTSENG